MEYRFPHFPSLRWFLGWFPQVVKLSRARIQAQVRLLGLAILVGIVAGVGAIGFYIATRAVEHYALGVVGGYYPEPHPGGEPLISWPSSPEHPFYPWLLLLIPTLGGLLSGLLVFTVAPEAEGHGTDAVIAAYHYRQGQIRPRVPLVKIVASALTIGTGGSGGREGPIAQIGAGFGSLLGNLLRLRPADRRVLMAAGMGAGIAAIFRAPLAGTMFAAEVLYRSPEFESEVIIPAGFASVVSYCIFGAYSGWEPLFTIPDLAFTNPWQLGPYLLLALSMALLAMIYTRSFYAITAIFRRLPIRPHFRPAIGAFLTGVVGVLLYFAVGRQQQVLAVLAFGYSAIQDAMTQDVGVSAGLLLAVAFGKILTTGLTIGSGARAVSWAFHRHRRVRRRRTRPSVPPLLALAGASSRQLRRRWDGRFLRRRCQDPVLYNHHGERDDGRIPPALAVSLGLRPLLHPLRRAVDLLLPGRRTISFTGTSGQLRSAGVGRGSGEGFPYAGARRAGVAPERFSPRRPKTAERRPDPGASRCRWRQSTLGYGQPGRSRTSHRNRPV